MHRLSSQQSHLKASYSIRGSRRSLIRLPASSTRSSRLPALSPAAAGATSPSLLDPSTSIPVTSELLESDTRMLMVKVGVASMTGKLDLTDCRLPFLPPTIFDLGSELEELCLAGNMLTELPSGISKLTGLKRLQLAGNMLQTIPREIGDLANLEGLWLGGNMIQGELPTEIGKLLKLKQLSVSGNCIESLPSSIGDLTSLVELEVAGNNLTSIPDRVYQLKSLKKLCLNGNRITHLPQTGIEGLETLEELFLMGNRLKTLPEGIGRLKNLKQLSVADNELESLPLDILDPGPSSDDHKNSSLQKLWAYGNRLNGFEAIRGLLSKTTNSLDSLWLEGNPDLGAEASQALLNLGVKDKLLPSLKALGLDLLQLKDVSDEVILAAGSVLKAGEVILPSSFNRRHYHHGYFKLVPSPSSDNEAQANLSSIAAGRLASPKPVLLVSFGSAPGTPNWGGLIGKLYKEAKEERDRAFDVLYVVDPSRSWYQGGSEADDHDDNYDSLEHYRDRLKEYTSRYGKVVMVGDSMGATAALLFADLATTVLAFCPQVDLSTASIRPGRDSLWFERLKDRVLSVMENLPSSTSVTSFVGTWQHDLDQVNLLPEREEGPKVKIKVVDSGQGQGVKKGGVRVKVFSLDSHRLALYLDKQGKLLPIVRDAIAHEQGERTGNIRISNLL